MAQTDSRVTPTAVTGAAGYLWMLGTYPCSTGTCSVGVMRSSDGGKSFVRVGTLPAANYQIEFANREDGYAFGAGGGPLDESRLYWTGDGGEDLAICTCPISVLASTGSRHYRRSRLRARRPRELLSQRSVQVRPTRVVPGYKRYVDGKAFATNGGRSREPVRLGSFRVERVAAPDLGSAALVCSFPMTAAGLSPS